MRNIVTNAAGVTVLQPIDKTKTFARRGRYSTGATVIQSKRGRPHEILHITAQNFQRVLGTAWHPSVGEKHEGMRHLHDALQACPVVNVVRVVGTGAKFPTMALLKLGPDAWKAATAYEVGDLVKVADGILKCKTEHTSGIVAPTVAGLPNANWEVNAWVAGPGPWQAETAYVVGDKVTVADGALICTTAHTSGTTAPTVANPGASWSEWKGYHHGDMVTVAGGTLICVRQHIPDAVAPTIASHGENWAVEKGAWQYTTDPQDPVQYSVNDIVTVEDGKLICTAAHTSGASSVVDPPRCDAPDAGFVVTTLLTSAWAPFNHRVEKAALDFVDENDSPVTPTIDETDELILFWVLDGDASEDRRLEITEVDYEKKRFNLTFYDKDELGHEFILEGPYQVGLKVDDLDDLERPCFIETVLEGQSNIFRCQINPDITFDQMLYRTKAQFAGGTAGAAPAAAQYEKAWNVFRDEQTTAHLMFAAGCYDLAVLKNCLEIADLRHASFFFDCPPTWSPRNAKQWLRDETTKVRLLQSRQAQAYYCPYRAADPFYSGFATWGASGEAVAACARGNSIARGHVPGVHYSPAGVKRATLSRRAVQPLYPHEQINREAYYQNRINPVVIHEGARRLVIDDALTRVFSTSYLRFTHVNRIANYVDHEFYRGAQRIKHDPDGVTERSLHRLMKYILEGLVMAEALVPPREAGQGKEPYTVKITQQDFDLWQVDWAFCPTGSARRIVGQPIILK